MAILIIQVLLYKSYSQKNVKPNRDRETEEHSFAYSIFWPYNHLVWNVGLVGACNQLVINKEIN